MSRLSMNEMTTNRWSFEDDVQNYLAAGYDAIGVWRDKLSDYGEEKGCELLRETGLSVSTLMWAGGFTGSDGRSYHDAVADGLEAIHLAADLQADCLLVHSGTRNGHTFNHSRRILREALKVLVPAARNSGVVLALEPMHAACAQGWTFLTDFNEAWQIVRSFETEFLKLAFDSYHLAHDEQILSRLPELVPSIALVQLGDARHAPQGEPNRCRLLEGSLPLPRVVSAFLEAGYTGYFDIELMGEEIEFGDYQEILTHSRDAFAELCLQSAKSL